MNKNLFSIAIPTFNRLNPLKRTIDVLLKQISPDTGVEIILVDNHSDDGTDTYGKKLADEHDFISFYRNNENLGYDGNVHRALSLSTSTYTWILADDDWIHADAIKTILKILSEQKQEYALVYLNYGLYDFKTDSILDEHPDTKGVSVCNNIVEFVKSTQYRSSFVSANILNTNMYLESKPEKHIGTQWIHFCASFDMLKDSKALVINDCYLYQGYETIEESRKGSKIFFYVYANLNFANFILSLRDQGYPKEIVKIGIDRAKKDNFRQIIITKKLLTNASYGEWFKVLPIMIKIFKAYPSLWFIDIPLLLAPRITIKALYKGLLPYYKKINN